MTQVGERAEGQLALSGIPLRTVGMSDQDDRGRIPPSFLLPELLDDDLPPLEGAAGRKYILVIKVSFA